MTVPAEESFDREHLLTVPVACDSGTHSLTLRFHCEKEGLIRLKEFRFV
jgi:hypothetical protein